jgi:hypothetical protein
MAGFVYGAGDALLLVHLERPALDAHQHLVAPRPNRRADTLVRPERTAKSAASFTRFDEIGARKTGRAARNLPQGPRRLRARPSSRESSGSARGPLMSGAPTVTWRSNRAGGEGARDRGCRGGSGGRRRRRSLVLGKAVHFDQQLIEGLSRSSWLSGVAAAAATNRVELVDEDNAGLVATGILEQLANA